MSNATKACLFGGALLCAGQTAHAQTFQYGAGFATAGAYDYAFFVTDTAYVGGALNTFASYTGSYGSTVEASTMQTSTSMRAAMSFNHSDYGYGYNYYAYANLQQEFQVSASGTLAFSWDFRRTSWTGNGPLVTLLENGSVVDGVSNYIGIGFSSDNSPSVMIDVQAGNTYELIFGQYNSNGTAASWDLGLVPGNNIPDNEIFLQVDLIVPTPGAAAILGAGSLLAVRRRRRS